jgi:hypothetical protein
MPHATGLDEFGFVTPEPEKATNISRLSSLSSTTKTRSGSLGGEDASGAARRIPA